MHIYIKYYSKFNCFLMLRYNDVAFATFPNSRYTSYRWYVMLEMVCSSHPTSQTSPSIWRWHDWSTFIEQINDSVYVLYYYIKVQEKCEYTKWVIRSRYSQDRQYRGKKRKNRTTNNDLQTTDDIAKRTRRFSVMERRNKRQIYHNCDISFLT